MSYIIINHMESLRLQDPTTLADNVEKVLFDYIKEEGLKPGDKIMTEEELSNQLGVSRNIVREALSRMRAMGMISSRKKRGMVLQTVDVSKNLGRIISPPMLDKATLIDLLELRLWLEKAIAPSVFANITDQDISNLEAILNMANPDIIAPISLEQEFHSRIFSIARNHTVTELQQSFMPVYRYVHDNIAEFTALDQANDKPVIKASHHDILDALRKGDVAYYINVIDTHLYSYKLYIDHYRNN